MYKLIARWNECAMPMRTFNLRRKSLAMVKVHFRLCQFTLQSLQAAGMQERLGNDTSGQK